MTTLYEEDEPLAEILKFFLNRNLVPVELYPFQDLNNSNFYNQDKEVLEQKKKNNIRTWIQ